MTDPKSDEEEEETPRVCVACGGRGCRWCTRGYQDREQQGAWKKFRARSRRTSSTNRLLEKTVRELMERLEEAGDHVLAEHGRKCLEDWMSASPDTVERQEASMNISVFQNHALVVLMKACKPK